MTAPHRKPRFAFLCPSAASMQTSGFDLVASECGSDPNALERVRVLLDDAFNKARAFSIVNKLAVIPALLLSLLAIIWPVLEQGQTAEGWLGTRAASSTAQAVCTALAGVCAFVYTSYKKRQTCIESAMRELVFGTSTVKDRISHVIKTLDVLDTGLEFDHTSRASAGSSKGVTGEPQ